jgi:general stress protein 26
MAEFAEMEEELHKRAQRMVWCTVTTVDRKGRPRSRILHPLWEGSTAWIMTSPTSLKAKHIARTPYVSLSYWDQQHQQIYADCKASWVSDPAEKERVWKLFESTPEPYGYNPAMFWPNGPASPEFGVLKCEPWRLELYQITDMMQGKKPLVWKP